jgi:hypothetical protein
LQCKQRQQQVGEDFSGNQPGQFTLWLHRASLNSTPQRASSSEEQHSQQSSKQQRRQPTSATSRPATATNRRPVTPRAPHNASCVFKEGNPPHKGFKLQKRLILPTQCICISHDSHSKWRPFL